MTRSRLKREIRPDADRLDLLIVKLPIRIVAVEIGRHDPKMPARSSSRPFEAAKHVGVDDPTQFLM